MDEDAMDFESIDREQPPPTFRERVEETYGSLGRYLGMNFEQFRTSIDRSPSPDDELTVWAGVASVWNDYRRKYLADKPSIVSEERSIVAAIVAISHGEQELRKLSVSFDVATSLLSCYVDLADELPFSSP